MVLIIAEKPSLARNIVAGIGQMKKYQNYYEGSGYIVTWAFGHLFSLCDIEGYTGATSTGKWSMENIPCFPDEFRFHLKTGEDKKPDAGVIRQFETIKTLCNRQDVDAIVNAGDADREGEIIVRLCVMNALESEKKLQLLHGGNGRNLRRTDFIKSDLLHATSLGDDRPKGKKNVRLPLFC